MLQNIELIFTDMELMMRKLKKLSYEANMKRFREEQGHFIDEMVGFVKDSDNKDEAVSEVGRAFADGVFDAFNKKGKISGRKQADMNFFMIYYVFPAILLTEDEYAEKICDGVRDAWNAKFKDTNINYTTYEKLHSTFRNKILGLF